MDICKLKMNSPDTILIYRNVPTFNHLCLGQQIITKLFTVLFPTVVQFSIFQFKKFLIYGSDTQIDIMMQSDAIQYFKMKYISDILKLHSPPL